MSFCWYHQNFETDFDKTGLPSRHNAKQEMTDFLSRYTLQSKTRILQNYEILAWYIQNFQLDFHQTWDSGSNINSWL